MNLKYAPKHSTSAAFFVLLLIVAVLFLGRKTEFLKVAAIPNVLPDFYQHISNFAISYILFSGIGYMWLLLGMKFKYIAGLGLAILYANFIYELWLPILNTCDITDAYYGLSGTIIAFIFLYWSKLYGLNVNMSY